MTHIIVQNYPFIYSLLIFYLLTMQYFILIEIEGKKGSTDVYSLIYQKLYNHLDYRVKKLQISVIHLQDKTKIGPIFDTDTVTSHVNHLNKTKF